jgi:hypothetical protein
MDAHSGRVPTWQQPPYQKLRQVAKEARVLDGIRQGIEDMKAGRTVSLDQFKEHARTKHGIPV